MSDAYLGRICSPACPPWRGPRLLLPDVSSTLRPGCLSHSHSSRAFPPAYNNSELITAFSQSFLSVVRSLTPNDKFYTDLKPEWSIWQDGTTEMLFNVTSAGGAVVQTTTTDPSLLERCA